MGRRVYTYPDLPGYAWMNMLSSFGAVFMTASALIFVANIVISLVYGKPAEDNPWDAWTLEWASTSPPPDDNFAELPPILGRRPLWDLANPDRPDPAVGTSTDAVITPEKSKVNVLAFIFSETAFFGVLILSYLFFNASPQPGPSHRDLNLPKTILFSACLFASSFTIWRAEAGLRNRKQAQTCGWLGATVILGGIFMLGQGFEYISLFRSGVTVSSNMFATSFFTLTGFHGLHVCLGLAAMLILLYMALMGDFRSGHSPAFEAVSYYWHFVDGVWVFVFTAIYLLPLLFR